MAGQDIDVEALVAAYGRLRAAARAVVDAADYPAEDSRVYASQLRDLKRELEGVPQPTNKLTWMSPT